jgi:hypothetical protein
MPKANCQPCAKAPNPESSQHAASRSGRFGNAAKLGLKKHHEQVLVRPNGQQAAAQSVIGTFDPSDDADRHRWVSAELGITASNRTGCVRLERVDWFDLRWIG